MDGHLEISPCVLQDIGPLGPLPCSHSTFWAAAPKGTKSCRTQGDFCSSFRHSVRSSPQALSGLKFALSGLKSALSDQICPLRPEICPLRPEISQIQGLKGQISGLRGQISGLREPGGTDGRNDGRTNKSPPVFYRTSSPSGPLPKKWSESRAAAPKGRCPVEHRGKFRDVRPSVLPSVLPSFRPPPPLTINA